MRIHVTGNAGAGKTTSAARIAAAFDLPLHGLDAIVWSPGWRKTPPDERARLEEELIAGERWVIEGVSSRVQRAADAIVFLDVPPAICLARCARRNLPFLFRSRPGLPERCPEWRIAPRLVRIITTFERRLARSWREEAARDGRWIHLASPRSADEIVERVRARIAATEATPRR